MTSNIKAGETILEIPTSLIKTEISLPKRIRAAIPSGSCSVNGLIALELALDTSKTYTLWRSTLPTFQDVKSSMPLFWPEALQSLLPPASTALLQKQQHKLKRDWTAISSVPRFSHLTLEHYTYNWLLVSTRTFFYTPPNLPADETPETDECLAIVPFGDYFNHSPSPSVTASSTPSITSPSTTCKVSYSPTCYEFLTPSTNTAPIAKGTELFISYGSHSNDFLLVEYGFILPLEQNPNDALSLDDAILPLFSAEQKKLLSAADYLGNYVLNHHLDDEDEDDGMNGDANDEYTASDLACYRTTTALRLLCTPFRKWKRGLSRGFDDHDAYQSQVDSLLHQVLEAYLEKAEQRRQKVLLVDVEKDWIPQKTVLVTRWDQILAQLKTAKRKLG